MPKLNKTYPHSLGRMEAVQRIKAAIEQEKISKANIVEHSTENWISDNELEYSIKIFGYHVDGSLEINEDHVAVQLNLPLIAVMVKGMIEDQLRQEMEKLLR